jgi:hypothetical protein
MANDWRIKMTQQPSRARSAGIFSLLALGVCLGAGSARSSPGSTSVVSYEYYDVGTLSRIDPDSCWLFVRSFGRSGVERYRLEDIGRFGDGDTVVVTGGTF